MGTLNALSLVIRTTYKVRKQMRKLRIQEVKYLPRVPHLGGLQTFMVAYPTSKNVFELACTSTDVYLFIHKA